MSACRTGGKRKMKRREFLKSSAMATAAVAIGPQLLKADGRRPNILLIIVDQMSYPRFAPDSFPKNIDRIAKSGVSFTKHFVSAVPCSPSRACLMTGTYTTQNHMFHNCDFVEGKSVSRQVASNAQS
jgi:arylsulfatase A-like enzyme